MSFEMFAPKGGYCVYYPSRDFVTWGKTVCEQFSVYCMECFLFSVLWFNFMNKKNMLLLLQLKKCPPFKTKSCCIGRKV